MNSRLEGQVCLDRHRVRGLRNVTIHVALCIIAMLLVAVAHEMIRIVFYMLRNGEAYRGENRGVTERNLKSMERMALNGLRN